MFLTSLTWKRKEILQKSLLLDRYIKLISIEFILCSIVIYLPFPNLWRFEQIGESNTLAILMVQVGCRPDSPRNAPSNLMDSPHISPKVFLQEKSFPWDARGKLAFPISGLGTWSRGGSRWGVYFFFRSDRIVVGLTIGGRWSEVDDRRATDECRSAGPRCAHSQCVTDFALPPTSEY